jgi:hypothetical protein
MKQFVMLTIAALVLAIGAAVAQTPYADHAITAEKLSAVTAEIGVTQAELRAAHLKYHLSTVAMLEPSQIQQYSVLRGYGSPEEHHHHH